MNRPILNYHAVGPTSSPAFRPWAIDRAEFGAQLDLLLAEGFRGVSLAESLADPQPDHVALTFDDGYEDFVTAAVPELEKRKFGATVYVATAYIGDGACWLGDTSEDARAMASWDQLRSIVGGPFEIGSHSHTHPQLDLLGATELEREITTSRETLIAELGIEVDGFCYPHGFHGARVRQAVIDGGYRYACAVKHKMSHDADDRFALARIVVTNAVTRSQLRGFLHGDGLRKSPTWAEHAMARGFRELRRMRRVLA